MYFKMFLADASFSKWGFAYGRRNLINVRFLTCLITSFIRLSFVKNSVVLKGDNWKLYEKR